MKVTIHHAPKALYEKHGATPPIDEPTVIEDAVKLWWEGSTLHVKREGGKVDTWPMFNQSGLEVEI